MREIEIGDKIRFRPAANYDHSAGFPNELQIEVIGTVEYINREHNFFSRFLSAARLHRARVFQNR